MFTLVPMIPLPGFNLRGRIPNIRGEKPYGQSSLTDLLLTGKTCNMGIFQTTHDTKK